MLWFIVFTFRPEEKIKQLEKKVNELIEESCHAHEIGDYPLVSYIWVKLIEYTQNSSTAYSAALSEIEKCSPEYMFYFVAGPWKGKRSRQKRTKALQPTRAKCFEWSDKPWYYIFSKYQLYAYKSCNFAAFSAIFAASGADWALLLQTSKIQFAGCGKIWHTMSQPK